MLDLRNISKHYGGKTVLAIERLEVPAGRTTVLIGPSGCGKSTLLRLIVGLILPERGTIHIGGTLLSAQNRTRLRRRMGYVIQEGGLFPHWTVRDNVTVMARFLGWARPRIEQRLGELADLVHLDAGLFARYPDELSGGQRQRVSLMRALMLDPDLLLLDEPLGALDPMIRYELQKDLKAIFERLGKTVVLVTHDLAEAAWFGDRVVLLRDGRIVQKGPIRELIQAPADPFVARFVHAQRGPMQKLADASS